jgi:RHS repeat-associated protein
MTTFRVMIGVNSLCAKQLAISHSRSKGATLETWTFGYDHRNQMVWAEKRATDGGTLQMRADYKYDAFGRRLEQAVDPDGAGSLGTSVKRFSYDGEDIWLDHFNLTHYFRGAAVDEVFARITGSGPAVWYWADRQGSVRDLADNLGAIQDHLDYDGYGNVTNETNPSFGDRRKYTGRELDSETGLQYHRARYYDPKVGRWTSEDPLGLAAGDANLYRYVHNGPANRTDPLGLWELSWEFVGKAWYTSVQAGIWLVAPPGFPRQMLPISRGVEEALADDIKGLAAHVEHRLEVAANAFRKNPGQPADVLLDLARDDLNTAYQAARRAVGFVGNLPWHAHQALEAFDRDPDRVGGIALYRGLQVGVACQQVGSLVRARSLPKAPQASRAVPDPSTPVGRRGSPLGSVQGNAPTTIGGRQYSGHAIDQMQARGIPPSVVENTIQTTKPIPGKRPGTSVYYDPINDVTGITDTGSGRVVTVGHGQIKQ